MIEWHEFAPPTPNRLHPQFVATAPHRIWAGDLTAIATRAGWLYLAVLARSVLAPGHRLGLSAKPDQQVALQALRMAVAQRRPPRGLIPTPIKGPCISAGPINSS